MGLKSWIFGKDKSSYSTDEAIGKLKVQLQRLDVEGQNQLRKADEQKELAKKLLKSGNKTGARQALTRQQIYLKKYNQNENTRLNLQSQIDQIETATSLKDVTDVMRDATVAVDTTLQDINPVEVDTIKARADDQRDRINEMSDILSDTTDLETDIDVDMADGIDDMMAAMELEIQSESHGDLPAAGTKAVKPQATKSEDTSEMEDDIKALMDQLDD